MLPYMPFAFLKPELVLMNVDASWNAHCVNKKHWHSRVFLCRRICWILYILWLIGSFYLHMLSDLLREIFQWCSLWQWGPKGWTGRWAMGRSLVQFHNIQDESGRWMSGACTSTCLTKQIGDQQLTGAPEEKHIAYTACTKMDNCDQIPARLTTFLLTFSCTLCAELMSKHSAQSPRYNVGS